MILSVYLRNVVIQDPGPNSEDVRGMVDGHMVDSLVYVKIWLRAVKGNRCYPGDSNL